MRCTLSTLALILCFSLVRNSSLDTVLSIALCTARCSNEQCRQTCNATTSKVDELPILQTKSEANVSLQCKDVNRLALKHNDGIYVVEEKNNYDDVWTSPIISRENFCEFSKLNSSRRYRYRVRKVTPKGIARPEISQWVQTHKEKYVPKNVKNISIGRLEVNKSVHGRLQTYLDITPADDLNCVYEIVHWGGEHNLHQYHLDATRDFRLKLDDLKYNSNNTIYVTSKNYADSLTSANTTLAFKTPPCLDVNNDLKICAPPPVSGLQISGSQGKKKNVSLHVAWDRPKLLPNNYTLIVVPLDWENSSLEITASGNQSAINVTDVVKSRQYKIGVIAESEGGSSVRWKIFSINEQTSVGSPIIVAVSLFLMSVVIFLTIIIIYYRANDRLKQKIRKYSVFEHVAQKDAFDEVLSPLKNSSLREFADKCVNDKFEISADRLEIRKILGSGISGVVKLATLQNDHGKTINVAVKMLREDASESDMKNFQHEIQLMKSTGNHKNIVSIIGCCTLNKNAFLVVEYCSKGDLLSYLRKILEETATEVFKRIEQSSNSSTSFFPKNNNVKSVVNNYLYDIQQEAINENKLTQEELLNIARQVANGMEFLASNRIVHRDLAARNVLVCADKTVKISDFGLSRDIYQENVYKKQSNDKLPIKWMAIEALTHQVYTTYSDVWSFGILLYEIVTLGGNPYPEWNTSEVLHLLKSGYRMERPSNCGLQLYRIMRSCWHENPLNRPTFNQLKLQLDRLISTVTKNEYLNLSELLREPTKYHSLSNF